MVRGIKMITTVKCIELNEVGFFWGGGGVRENVLLFTFCPEFSEFGEASICKDYPNRCKENKIKILARDWMVGKISATKYNVHSLFAFSRTTPMHCIVTTQSTAQQTHL